MSDKTNTKPHAYKTGLINSCSPVIVDQENVASRISPRHYVPDGG